MSAGLAYVPLGRRAGVQRASKAFLHSYTQSLRAQLCRHLGAGRELLPPVVDTRWQPNWTRPSPRCRPGNSCRPSFTTFPQGKNEIAPGQSTPAEVVESIRAAADLRPAQQVREGRRPERAIQTHATGATGDISKCLEHLAVRSRHDHHDPEPIDPTHEERRMTPDLPPDVSPDDADILWTAARPVFVHPDECFADLPDYP